MVDGDADCEVLAEGSVPQNTTADSDCDESLLPNGCDPLESELADFYATVSPMCSGARAILNSVWPAGPRDSSKHITKVQAGFANFFVYFKGRSSLVDGKMSEASTSALLAGYLQLFAVAQRQHINQKGKSAKKVRDKSGCVIRTSTPRAQTRRRLSTRARTQLHSCLSRTLLRFWQRRATFLFRKESLLFPMRGPILLETAGPSFQCHIRLHQSWRRWRDKESPLR